MQMNTVCIRNIEYMISFFFVQSCSHFIKRPSLSSGCQVVINKNCMTVDICVNIALSLNCDIIIRDTRDHLLVSGLS